MKVLGVLLFAGMTIFGTKTFGTPSCDTCEFLSKFYMLKLETFFPDKYDSITFYADKWQESCGPTEPTLRIKTLVSIFKGNDSSFRITFTEYLRNFYITCTKRHIYSDEGKDFMYSIYKREFGFLPFNSAIDRWTQESTQLLLAKTGNPEPINAALYLFNGNFQSFDSILRFTRIGWLSLAVAEGKLPRNNSFGYTSQYGVGTRFPIGLQGDYFPPNIQISLNFGLYKRNYRLCVEYSGRFSYVKNRIQFKRDSKVFDLDRFLFNDAGLNLSKIFYSRRKFFAFEPQLGIGYEYIRCQSINILDGSTNIMTLHTIYAETGCALLRQFNMGTFGLLLTYNYSVLPKVDGTLNNFGTTSICVTVILKYQ